MKVFNFIIGKPHKVMGMAYLMIVVNMVVQKRTGSLKALLLDTGEKLIAYTAFIIIANMIDNLAIDSLSGWKGSTQFMVCIWIAVRNIRLVYNYLSKKYDMDIPIIGERLTMLEKYRKTDSPTAKTGNDNIDDRIIQLRKELLELENQATEPKAKIEEGES
jgi:hypothetical protein